MQNDSGYPSETLRHYSGAYLLTNYTNVLSKSGLGPIKSPQRVNRVGSSTRRPFWSTPNSRRLGKRRLLSGVGHQRTLCIALGRYRR